MGRYVIKKGHTKIGFVGNQVGFENIADRFYGFQRALLLSQLELNPDWVIDDRDPNNGKIYEDLPLPPSFTPNQAGSADGSASKLSRVPENMPTAFVCNCDYTADAWRHTLEQRGFTVPDEVSIVDYDNFLTGSSFAHELTTLDVNLKLMAQFAVSNMIQLLNGQQPTNHIRRLEGQIVELSSVRAMGS